MCTKNHNTKVEQQEVARNETANIAKKGPRIRLRLCNARRVSVHAVADACTRSDGRIPDDGIHQQYVLVRPSLRQRPSEDVDESDAACLEAAETVRPAIRTDICMNMCMDMCMDVCVDMCMDMPVQLVSKEVVPSEGKRDEDDHEKHLVNTHVNRQ